MLHILHKIHGQIESLVQRSEPIQIVLPTLPFKDQNPLTTHHSLGAVDLGEYLIIAQLKDIGLSIENAYLPGCHITVVTDGTVYSDLFAGGNTSAGRAYSSSCQKIIQQMALQDHISLIDMQDCIRDKELFDEIRSGIETKVEMVSGSDPSIAQSLNGLAKSMLMNITVPYGFDEYLYIVNGDSHDIPNSLWDQAYETALRYASFLLTSSHMRTVETVFPDAIRATVHPKHAPQIPIHLVNRHSVVFPYNGVPVVSSQKIERTDGNIRRSARILRYAQVFEYNPALEVYRVADSEPFYYLTQ